MFHFGCLRHPTNLRVCSLVPSLGKFSIISSSLTATFALPDGYERKTAPKFSAIPKIAERLEFFIFLIKIVVFAFHYVYTGYFNRCHLHYKGSPIFTHPHINWCHGYQFGSDTI